MRARHLIRIAAFSLCAAPPLFAHHAVRESYSADTLVNLSGTVSEVRWINPHVSFVLDTVDASGKPVAWTVELGGAPSAMQRRGVSPDFIKAGDELRLEVWTAKDGTPLAHARSITFADGTRMDLPEDRWMPIEAALPPP